MSGSQAGQDWYDPNMYGPPGAISAGMSGPQNNDGYTGQVSNLHDFISAVLGGAGVVFGGLPGAAAAGINLATGAKNGLGPIAALKDLRTALFGGKDAAGGLSAGTLDINPANASGFGAGNLAGALGGGMAGNLGDITGNPGGDRLGGGPDLSGGDRGAAGDRTAELRGLAQGGALNQAICGKKRR